MITPELKTDVVCKPTYGCLGAVTVRQPLAAMTTLGSQPRQ
jgi:hypothetical protein